MRRIVSRSFGPPASQAAFFRPEKADINDPVINSPIPSLSILMEIHFSASG
jgi:hypothetical protein